MIPAALRARALFSSLRPATLALAGLALVTTGCANFDNAVTGSTSATPAASLSGNVHGGRQPVVGATVAVWAAGNTGYGSAATRLASTTTDANGNFTFAPGSGNTYSCPASNSTTATQLIYLTSTGGQPTTGITNAAASFMLALGSCSTIISTQPNVNINEVTTIGSMFALQQFFSPSTESIGTSATNLQGLTNAFATVNNLVSVNTGAANAAFTVLGSATGFSTTPSVTVTPEATKINTLADVLAACVNTNGSTTLSGNIFPTCGLLFSSVSSPAATDTLQAAYYLATNPTSTVGGYSNIATIYNLASATSPYQPTLTAAPTDWTLGVTYGSTSQSTAGAYLITDPEYVAIDANGNVWMANYSSGSTLGGNSVTQMSPTGTATAQVLSASILGPAWLSIDQTGNIWVPNYGVSSTLASTVVEYTTGGATNTFNVSPGPQKTAIDGKGNVFVLSPSYKGAGALAEIPVGSAGGTTPTSIATGVITDFSSMAFDSNYNLWISGGSTGTYDQVSQFLYSATSPNYPVTPVTTTAGGITEPEALAIDGGNNIWTANYGKGTLTELAATNTSTIVGAAGSPFTTPATTTGTPVYTGLTKPQYMAIDGGGNVWITNAVVALGSVYEFSNAGATLSPAPGFVHSTGESYGIAIDGSGNVWLGNYTGGASATTAGFLTEVVGAALPVVTPLAAGLPTTPGGTNRVGVRP